jgi:NCS1 family nucleobase:cation symporter-1
VVATFTTIIPLLPALANKVNPKIHLATGLKNLFTINWLYGFFLSIALYYFLNLVFPDKESSIPRVVTGFEYVEGVEVNTEGYSGDDKESEAAKDRIEARSAEV